MPDNPNSEPKTMEEMIETGVPNIPHEDSGLMNILSDFLPEDAGNGEVNYLEEIKDLPEMDKINLTDFFNKDDWKPEELLEMELTDASTEKLKGLFPETYTDSGGESEEEEILPDKALEDLSHEELIAEFKKQQGFADTRGTEITNLQKEIEELKSQTPSGELEVAEDFKSLSSDFIGNYDKLSDKYNLPKTEVLKKLLVAGDDNTRIAQWQQTELKGIIEKKHGLVEGEFAYDANEAADASTPSYDWDDMTAKKRADIVQERQHILDRNTELAAEARKRQDEDYKWYADVYENGDIEKVKGLVTSMNSTVTDITAGKVESTKHPFAMRNVLRGYYFDDLVKTAVQTAVDELNAEYAKNQMYLPGKEMPTDPTNVGGNVQEAKSFSKDDLERSPMLSSLSFSLVDKK
jgi:hypothetical protein